VVSINGVNFEKTSADGLLKGQIKVGCKPADHVMGHVDSNDRRDINIVCPL